MGTWSRLRVVSLLCAHFPALARNTYTLDVIAIVVLCKSDLIRFRTIFFLFKIVVHAQSASADTLLFVFSPEENAAFVSPWRDK